MKPKTKIQFEIDDLAKKLPKPGNDFYDWMRKKVFTNYLYKTIKQSTCLECGHTWNDKTIIDVCPGCGNKLTLLQGRKRSNQDENHFTMITTIENYQVIRIFFFRKKSKLGMKPLIYFDEVVQHWIRSDGNRQLRTIGRNAFGYGYKWILGSDLEFRKKNDIYFIHTKHVYPKRKFLKIIRRNGFKGNYHTLHPAWFFELILSNSTAETLLKVGQFKLFFDFDRYHEKIKFYWSSIKICIRNNYLINNPSDWFDQLALLLYFHKDIHSPKYICPVDLNLEHSKLIKNKRELEARRRLEELKAKIEKENIIYRKNRKKFFGIKISNDIIDVVVLNSVKEFYKEGEILDHCIFENEYYKKKDSLILSARKEEERLETIELDLRNFKVIQSRGLRNKSSTYHNEIIKLINSNIKTIKKTVRNGK